MLILQNCGNKDIPIPRCQNNRCIEHVKNPYFDNISEIKSSKWEIKVLQNPHLPEPEPLSQEDNAKLFAQAKINVPIEEKYKYKDLLCKHHNVLAKTSKIWARQ
jgi:hypothetical protein